MQNLDASKILPLAFDFQNALQTFSSTKANIKQIVEQRHADTFQSECVESKDIQDKPAKTEQLFTEIKEMLADF